MTNSKPTPDAAQLNNRTPPQISYAPEAVAVNAVTPSVSSPEGEPELIEQITAIIRKYEGRNATPRYIATRIAKELSAATSTGGRSGDGTREADTLILDRVEQWVDGLGKSLRLDGVIDKEEGVVMMRFPAHSNDEERYFGRNVREALRQLPEPPTNPSLGGPLTVVPKRGAMALARGILFDSEPDIDYEQVAQLLATALLRYESVALSPAEPRSSGGRSEAPEIDLTGCAAEVESLGHALAFAETSGRHASVLLGQREATVLLRMLRKPPAPPQDAGTETVGPAILLGGHMYYELPPFRQDAGTPGLCLKSRDGLHDHRPSDDGTGTLVCVYCDHVHEPKQLPINDLSQDAGTEDGTHG